MIKQKKYSKHYPVTEGAWRSFLLGRFSVILSMRRPVVQNIYSGGLTDFLLLLSVVLNKNDLLWDSLQRLKLLH